MEAYINPIPAGLVLTGIVVSVSVTALMLALTVRLYRQYHTLDIDEITALPEGGGNLMSQPLWHSIPYLCILLPLGSAAVTSVLKPRWARYWTMFALLVVTSLSARDFRHFRIRRGELHLHDGSLSRAVGQRNPCGSAGGRDCPVLQPDYAAESAAAGKRLTSTLTRTRSACTTSCCCC